MIRVRGLTVSAGNFSLENISLEIPDGQYAVLMGKTGCGKTTLLEAICGLRPCAAGRVELGGRDATQLRPGERGIGYVPQDRAIFSTLTVFENLAFALRVRNWDEGAVGARVDELAALLGVSHLLDRSPRGLSGGEQQRIALGRALAARPVLLMMDEPLSALDEETRGDMYRLLRDVRRKVGVTALHVTHSRDEAAELADRILLLQNGQVVEVGGVTTSGA